MTMNKLKTTLASLWGEFRPGVAFVPIALDREQSPGTRIQSEYQHVTPHVPGVRGVPNSDIEASGDDWEERAAILEFDAGLSRAEAESLAGGANVERGDG